MPPCGVPSSVGANPLPASNTPAASHPAIMSLAGNAPSWLSRKEWLILSNDYPSYYRYRGPRRRDPGVGEGLAAHGGGG